MTLWVSRFGFQWGNPHGDLPVYAPYWWRWHYFGPLTIIDSGHWARRLRLDR